MGSLGHMTASTCVCVENAVQMIPTPCQVGCTEILKVNRYIRRLYAVEVKFGQFCDVNQ